MEDKQRVYVGYQANHFDGQIWKPWIVQHDGNTQCFTTKAKRDEYAAWIRKLQAQLAAKAVTRD